MRGVTLLARAESVCMVCREAASHMEPTVVEE